MPKDYKHPQAPQNNQAPGWVWLLVGLALGLAITVILQVREDRREAMGPQPAADAAPASADDAAVNASAKEDPAKEDKYTFYDMLTNFEVVVPEDEAEASSAGPEISEPGFYVLQVGSFSKHADADRRKAELALMGVESRIQKVTIDEDRIYHRVRIGPLDDLERLNGIRDRLREAGLETLVLKAEEGDDR